MRFNPWAIGRFFCTGIFVFSLVALALTIGDAPFAWGSLFASMYALFVEHCRYNAYAALYAIYEDEHDDK